MVYNLPFSFGYNCSIEFIIIPPPMSYESPWNSRHCETNLTNIGDLQRMKESELGRYECQYLISYDTHAFLYLTIYW